MKLNTDICSIIAKNIYDPKYELIASHSFRRSFASNYYKIIPTPILINTTGQSKESMFLKFTILKYCLNSPATQYCYQGYIPWRRHAVWPGPRTPWV